MVSVSMVHQTLALLHSRADDGYGTLANGVTQASNLARTLVETSQLCTEVSRISRVSGHLRETTRNFTQSLSPTRRRISHHGDIGALVAEVLCESDTGVDGCLTRRDRHVRSIGDERRTLHDRFLTVTNLHGEFGELDRHQQECINVRANDFLTSMSTSAI